MSHVNKFNTGLQLSEFGCEGLAAIRILPVKILAAEQLGNLAAVRHHGSY